MLFNKKFLALSSIAALCLNFGVTLGDDHDHDSDDTDTHDHEHDSHSCHYGVISPYFPFPLAEDECGSITSGGDSYSFIFECHDESEGEAFIYSGTSCDGSVMAEFEITDTTMFDCSSESTCDILIVNRDYYGNTSTDCSETAQDEMVFAFSTGSTCVNIGNDTYWGMEYDEDNEELTMSFYYGTTTCDSALFEVTYTSGCQEDELESAGYTMLSFEIEEDESSSSDANKIVSTMGLLSLVLLAVFY